MGGLFPSPETIKCLPFFKILNKVKDFVCIDESQAAFEELKNYMDKAPLLAKPGANEVLDLYLAMLERALSVVLVMEESKVQKPVYYVSKVLHGAKVNYSIIEKFTLALIMTSKKL